MIDIDVNEIDLTRPHSRRGVLRASLLGAGTVGLGPWLQPALAQQTSDAGRAVIQIWLAGGPSHLDLYDLKPHAPKEIRGPHKPISTSLPGLEICELLPLQAKLMDRLGVIRSLHHTTNDHVAGTHWMQTGYFGATAKSPSPTHPSVGSVISRLKHAERTGVPRYVHLTPELNIDLYTRSFGAQYLGATHEPLTVRSPFPPWNKDVEFGTPELAPVAGLNLSRLENRLQLLRQLDDVQRGLDSLEKSAAIETHQQRAFDLLADGAARRAFDLSLEPESRRRQYGMNAWGQGALLCRRLVEAGASFVTLNTDSSSNMWDNHGGLEKKFQLMLPLYDRMLTALIEDLWERGLNRQVLVLVCGEFGRTPRFNENAGRDHWGRAGCALLAGGKLEAGKIIGATNSRGEEPSERPITPADLLATLYRHLGIDPSVHFTNFAGRPVPVLGEGTPLVEYV